MAWVDTKLIKNFKVFKIRVNESFNVEILSNGYKYSDIKFIYAYESVDAVDYIWDSTLTLNGAYPNYYFSARENVTGNSVINVVIFEGDASVTTTDTSPKYGNWVTISAIGKITSFKLNSSNGFTQNLDLLGKGSWTKGKYTIIPMVSRMKFTKRDRGYNLSLENLSGNTYRCRLKSWRFTGKFIETKITSPAYTEIRLRDDCIFAMSYQKGFAGNHSVYVKLWDDGNLQYDVRSYDVALGYYSKYKRYGVPSTIAYRGDGSLNGYVVYLKEFLSENVFVEDAEVTCLVIEELV
ncbi:MAG: hypothetical protein ACRDDY_03875 [Clostridium sp.]|uniref:hypothetical protein n=1 Tax=Clostridium sp. TaxID=1506 RepID=UPI003EE698D6